MIEKCAYMEENSLTLSLSLSQVDGKIEIEANLYWFKYLHFVSIHVVIVWRWNIYDRYNNMKHLVIK